MKTSTKWKDNLWNEKIFANHVSAEELMVAQTVKTPPASLGQEDPLEKEVAACSSILAWGTPCTKEPGGLQSMGSQSWTQLND